MADELQRAQHEAADAATARERLERQLLHAQSQVYRHRLRRLTANFFCSYPARLDVSIGLLTFSANEWQAAASAQERDGIWQSELAQAQLALSELRSANASLRQQLEDAIAASLRPSDTAGQADVAAMQQRLADSQGRSVELQAQLDDLRQKTQPSASAPDVATVGGDAGQAAEQIAALRAELEALRLAADAASLDRDRAKAQLSRCVTSPVYQHRMQVCASFQALTHPETCL